MGIWECTTLFTFLHAGTEASRTDSFREGAGREGVSRSPRLGIESPCDQQHIHDEVTNEKWERAKAINIHRIEERERKRTEMRNKDRNAHII